MARSFTSSEGSGGAPAFMTKLPYWYLRMALRVGFRGPSWQRMRPLLEANLAEHEQLAAQQGRLAEFSAVTASVLLLLREAAPRAPAEPSSTPFATPFPTPRSKP